MTLLIGPNEIDDVLHDSLDSTAYQCLTMRTVLHDNVNSAACQWWQAVRLCANTA